MNSRSFLKRIERIGALICPPNSREMRIANLTAEHRKWFDKWMIDRKAWIARFAQADHAYAAMLEGENGPQLPTEIRNLIDGPAPTLPAGISETDAAEIYRDYLNEGRK
ncbi:MAG: hypothetical protein QHC67_02955 [Sphingobium sp.]|uniref:hypothetical protein n=1 Tax=Sphingobium sp. TaxID=1912891 RepID=UPI0029A7FDF6|nr:hypothetical protein [Sphingobium sp.]MDX3908757.1 hypothetical protein [Sphingobium sp.]